MLFKYERTAHVSKEEIEKYAEILNDYIDRLDTVAKADNYMYEESSINLPFDESILERIYKLKDKYVTKQLKYIIDIGIGAL